MGALGRLYRGENRIDFTKGWKWGVRISAVLFLASVASLAFQGLNLGIDFEGGISWEVKAPGVTIEQARDSLRAEGLGEAKIQVVGTDTLRVQAPADSDEKKAAVREALAKLASTQASEVGVSTVGPSWGGEITAAAEKALVVFLIAILGYVTLTFAGEWKMALGVFIAVVHDLVISVGVYSIFRFEVTPSTVIAFLTILGFSIYDTVVVYDRVLENSGRVGVASRMSYTEMMSLSMNQVLMRSVNTSVVSVLPVLSTLVVGSYILGAVTLQEFAIALTVGIAIGAYSSIFIAAPAVVFLKEREPRNRQLRQRLAGTKAAAVVAAAPAEGDFDEAEVEGSVPGTATAGGTKPTASRGALTPPGQAPFSLSHPPRPRKKGKKR